MSCRRTLLSLLVTLAFSSAYAQQGAVKVWEETLELPSYEVGAPDHNPRFYAGRAYQGAQGRVYPYPMIDLLTDNRVMKSYRAVYLENEFLKVCVVPEIGGRILSAVDKTNGYDFFYRQTVIKPALIGMIGAWISGGVEWNFPHHHRPSVFMPIDYVFESNPDGSATVWVGEMEIRHRMRWTIGLTIYPGKSYLEATLRPINRTPLIQSFLFFANVGIHSDENYQVFFPPGTEYATYHGKNQFAHWPVSHEVFNGIDYTEGVDVSWWKNHPEWTSMFAWNYKDDFFGGYDHGKEAGTVSFANHHLAPGKKFWEWSAGPRGKLWDQILTENDGPELELMTGAYSDNQPDYSWLQPLESKRVSIYWFPIRQLAGLKYADLNGALNLELDASGQALVGVNTVERHRQVTVQLTSNGQTLFERKIDIGPDRPFTTEVATPEGTTETSLRLTVVSSSGDELLSYQPQDPPGEPMPDPVEPPPPPSAIETVEEVYLAGLRLEQFFNPALDPEPYYEEALKRDRGHYDSHVALGIRKLKAGDFSTAENHFRLAVDRATRSYTSPRDGEALYYLGLVLRYQGRDEEAVAPLYRSSWSYAFHSPAFYQLAEISAARGDYESALDRIDRALATNQWSARSLSLKAAILRSVGRSEEALEITRQVLEEDPLNFWAGYEDYLGRRALGRADAQAQLDHQLKLMRDEIQSYLELALDYAQAGFRDEAIEVLSRRTDPKQGAPTTHAMAYYYLGWFHGQRGNLEKESELFRRAASQPPDYTFPFRLESIRLLERATEVHPDDARAPYYLGNLLFDHQPALAIEKWERARELDEGFATVHRNLAVGYQQHDGDIQRAIASMERAVELDPGDPRLYYELDTLYERGGVAAARRLALLESRRDVVKGRDDAMSRLVLLYVQTGRYDEAIEILTERHFHVWEGSRGLRDSYVDAYLLRGRRHLEEGEGENALADFEKALEFPFNLENAWPYRGGRLAQIYYMVASAHEALGHVEEARDYFQRAAEARQQAEWSDLRYYQARAIAKLGREADSRRLLEGLMDYASVDAESSIGFFSKFGEREPLNVRQARRHYLRGLVMQAWGRETEAQAQFRRALELDINHLWAAVQLGE